MKTRLKTLKIVKHLRSYHTKLIIIGVVMVLLVCAFGLFSQQASNEPLIQNQPTQESVTPLKSSASERYVDDFNTHVTGDYVITITANSFSPSDTSVPVGSTVIWTNKDEKSQTVYMPIINKGSPAINPGRSWSYTFNTTNTYSYYSSYYIDMKGRIVVYS